MQVSLGAVAVWLGVEVEDEVIEVTYLLPFYVSLLERRSKNEFAVTWHKNGCALPISQSMDIFSNSVRRASWKQIPRREGKGVEATTTCPHNSPSRSSLASNARYAQTRPGNTTPPPWLRYAK